jgi:hypothetical protein
MAMCRFEHVLSAALDAADDPTRACADTHGIASRRVTQSRTHSWKSPCMPAMRTASPRTATQTDPR